jgi:predicted ATPase/class 3 adenylate cyclase
MSPSPVRRAGEWDAPAMREQPSGIVTLVFTDIEGSTRLLEELGVQEYLRALTEHRRVVRDAFVGGYEVGCEGDSFFYAFVSAGEAVTAVERAMHGLEPGPIRIRVGVHTCEPGLDPPAYVGLDVHLAARIMAAGHGGQVLLSKRAHDLVKADTRDLGEHRLKDIVGPVPLYQLGTRPFPPLKTIANTNLPRPASSFIGRERELLEVVALLGDGTRLLTLSGPGGSGKTRLAIEAAAELVGEFRAGVFFVELAGLNDPALVIATIAQTLGASEEVSMHIGERELLLVLDNFEQVIGAAPELRRLVEACPNLKLLVTSRELLCVRGEVDYDVPPLASADAVSLFCARAGVEDGPAVAELCRRLDDLPLAVELAAARARALAPELIIERLGSALDLFRGGRDMDARQQTIRATIDWSYGLLAPEEQGLFARLAVFAGGCTVDAAEAVCSAELETLQSLLEKSLLRRTADRFWMLETVREYALERLVETGEAEALRRRHAESLLRFAETAGFAHDARTPERHDLVRAELTNLRASLDWSLSTDPELGIRLVTGLEMFWNAYDAREGARWLRELLDRGPGLPDALRAAAIKCYGGFVWLEGDFEEGYDCYEQALELYRRLGDEDGIALILPRIGAHLATQSGDTKRARALCEQSLERFRRAGFAKGEAESLLILGYVEYKEGRYEQALELSLASEQLAEQVGWSLWRVAGSSKAAECALRLGRVPDAAAYARRSLSLAHPIGERRATAGALALLACCAAASNEAGRAGRFFGAIEAEHERGRIGQWEAYRDDVAGQVLALPGPKLESGIAEGRALSFDQAVEYALSEY